MSLSSDFYRVQLCSYLKTVFGVRKFGGIGGDALFPLSFRGEVRSLMALAIRRSGEGELARGYARTMGMIPSLFIRHSREGGNP